MKLLLSRNEIICELLGNFAGINSYPWQFISLASNLISNYFRAAFEELKKILLAISHKFCAE